MRLFVIVLAVLISGYGHCKSEDSGQIFIDTLPPSTARPPKPTTADSRGDDDEISGSGDRVLSDESGSSGSGTDEPPTTVDVTVYTPSRSMSKKPTEVTEKSTKNKNELPEIATTLEPQTKGTGKPTTGINNAVDSGYSMVGGGIGKQEEGNDKPEPKAAAKQTFQIMTVEVIAAIVVGAVCAIILIAFLVYRLRKRDEGSYALTDGGYNDTYKLRGEGKEAFV